MIDAIIYSNARSDFSCFLDKTNVYSTDIHSVCLVRFIDDVVIVPSDFEVLATGFGKTDSPFGKMTPEAFIKYCAAYPNIEESFEFEVFPEYV